MKLSLLLVLSLFVISCSTEQDPIKDQPDRVRNGTPEGLRKVDNREPCPVESLILEANPEVAMFEEGSEGEVNIEGRVLGCGDKFEIDVLNLPEGATFDKSSGLLTYTPPIRTILGTRYYAKKFLRIRMKTLEKPVVIKNKTLAYFVRRPSDRQPVIELFKGMSANVEEGTDTEFRVYVRDDDSLGLNDKTYPPKLRIFSTSEGKKNALPFMKIRNPDTPIQQFNDPTLWVFRVSINTRGYENIITENMFLRFGMVAESQFGILSDVSTKRFKLINTVQWASVSWPDSDEKILHMQKGVRNSYTFWAYDSHKEGQVKAEFKTDCSALPGEAHCECTYVMHSAGTFCHIEWDVPRDYIPRRKDFEIEVVNHNSENGLDKRVISFTRAMILDEAPDAPPAPVCPEDPPEEPPGEEVPAGTALQHQGGES